MASSSTPPPSYPATILAGTSSTSTRTLPALLRSLAEDAGVQGPGELADELFLVAEGAIATAGIQRSDQPFAVAERAASRIIEDYMETV